MFINRLVNDGPAPTLVKLLSFTSRRQDLIAANIANVDTPGYVQEDLSTDKFQAGLRARLAAGRRASDFGAAFAPDDGPAVEELDGTRGHGILFHDRSARSIEQLTTDQAKNALIHNVAAELLRKQYDVLQTAIRERVV